MKRETHYRFSSPLCRSSSSSSSSGSTGVAPSRRGLTRMLSVVLVLFVSFSRFIAVESEQVQVYSAGSLLFLTCPTNVTFWQLNREETSHRRVIEARSTKPKAYVCSGRFESPSPERASKCRDGTVIDPLAGSSLQIEHVTMEDAGKYGCILEKNTTIVAETWRYVTVVDDDSKRLRVEVNDVTVAANDELLDILPESFLSATCTVAFTGFVEPCMEVIVRHSDGSEYSLAIKPRHIGSEFKVSEQAHIEADYIVTDRDEHFDILCMLHSHPSNSSVKASFHVNEKHSSVPARNGKLVGITVGVSIAVACVVMLIVIGIQKRKQRYDDDVQRPMEYEEVHTDDPPPQQSMFGATLAEVMQLQSQRLPHVQSRLPWIQTDLCKQILSHGGAKAKGILRVPGDTNKVRDMKNCYDRWEAPEGNRDDYGYLNALASLLKRWFREFGEPLIPSEFHARCVDACEMPSAACALVDELPQVNQLVLRYHIQFLREIDTEASQMNAQNLAMIIGPSIFHCFERGTMKFTETLINHLDTSDVSVEINDLLRAVQLA